MSGATALEGRPPWMLMEDPGKGFTRFIHWGGGQHSLHTQGLSAFVPQLLAFTVQLWSRKPNEGLSATVKEPT